MMSLAEYFDATEGFGVLATADARGQVDVAVYARPHVQDEDTIAFIMRDRLSHANLQTNPHAAYLFHERGGGYDGKRLYLTKLAETSDPSQIEATSRRLCPAESDDPAETRFLVTFRVDRALPLVGGGESDS